jgi:hypothetical protein
MSPSPPRENAILDDACFDVKLLLGVAVGWNKYKSIRLDLTTLGALICTHTDTSHRPLYGINLFHSDTVTCPFDFTKLHDSDRIARPLASAREHARMTLGY